MCGVHVVGTGNSERDVNRDVSRESGERRTILACGLPSRSYLAYWPMGTALRACFCLTTSLASSAIKPCVRPRQPGMRPEMIFLVGWKRPDGRTVVIRVQLLGRRAKSLGLSRC